LGNDVFGGTDLTENNLTAVDQSIDTCTNNFATLNPLDGAIALGNSTFSEGNLRFNSETNGNRCWTRSTIGVSSGKWYFEAKVQTASNNSAIGITDRPSANLTNLLGGELLNILINLQMVIKQIMVVVLLMDMIIPMTILFLVH